MREQFYAEITNQMLFTIFDSCKPRKSNVYRIHRHVELELGYIVDGEGLYCLEDEQYEVHKGDMLLIRTNEQHCVPTIYSTALTSFNIHIESYFLWNNCADFLDNRFLHTLFNVELPIQHHFRGKSMLFEHLRELVKDPLKNRFQIRYALLEILLSIMQDIKLVENMPEKNMVSPRFLDIQKAICYIHDHLTIEITLEDIAHAANMSRASLSSNFKMVTGVAPYNYLLIHRVDYALRLLRDTNKTIMEISECSGFNNLANFNRVFKKIIGMTPSEYRKSRR